MLGKVGADGTACQTGGNACAEHKEAAPLTRGLRTRESMPCMPFSFCKHKSCEHMSCGSQRCTQERCMITEVHAYRLHRIMLHSWRPSY